MKRASKDQYRIINEILTHSFKENKSVTYVLKEKTEKYISKLMDYSISNGIDFGEIFINEDETACAITIDPKKKKITLLTIVRDLKFIFNVIGFSNLRKVYLKEGIIKNTLPKDIDFVQL